jgi:parallel beta helix pectate lyase-like protein
VGRRSSPALTALTALGLVVLVPAATEAATASHGRRHLPRYGIARRVAVDRPPPRRRSPQPVAGGVGRPVPVADPAGATTPTPPPAPTCTLEVADLATARSAVAAASPGAVVCLADGSYGELTLSALKPAEVTLRAAHAGQATLDGATLGGSHLTLARFTIGDEVTVEPGSEAIAIEHNRISGGYFGVDAGPTTTTTIDDARIVGNQFVGPFGEDAIQLNRYHDGDGDGVGVLIEGNEITDVRENGNHSDCLQTVWVGDHLVFRRNYLHDNRCQGFFVNDQAEPIAGIVVEDNLFLRDDAPCAPTAPECGEPSYFQVFGPYTGLTMRRNTIWGGEPAATFQEGAGADTVIDANVVYRFWTATDLSPATYTDNTVCEREAGEGGAWPGQVLGETIACPPAFSDPAVDDYRLLGSSRGVDWAPGAQQFGP